MTWRDAEAAVDDDALGPSTLSRLFEASAARNADRPAQRYKGGVYDRSLVDAGVVAAAPDGDVATLTYAEMRDVVRHLATGFRDLGLGPDDRLGIFADTRMEWAHADFAALAAGGVVTTVYADSSESQVRRILADSEARGVVVENADRLRRVLAVEDDCAFEFVVLMDTVPGGSGMAGAVRDRDDVVTLDEVHRRGVDAFDADAYESWLADRDPGDLASLIYTSGTTGVPKGVRLTHRNFRANVNQCYRRFGPRPDRDAGVIGPEATTLSFLPLAHVFERLAGHFLMFGAGATVGYAESPDTLREDFQLVRPTVGTSVPRVYEKLYAAIRSEASSSAIRSRIFEWAVDVGRRHHEADDPGPLLDVQHALADRLVFTKVRDALGGRITHLISGGGSLSADLCALYHGMGIPILEGYGLTETAPVVSVNPPEDPKVGTIGPPVYEQSVRLDDGAAGDVEGEHGGRVGELLVSGPNVFEGYWNEPDETAAAFTDDGWFRTGDVVEIRPDDYLVFRERAKQLLVLSTGKNVAPGPIEDAFALSPLVDECMVLGDGRKFVSALVVPDLQAVRAWAEREGVDLPDDAAAVCRDERVRERLQAVVDEVNEDRDAHETIKRFRLVPEPFSTNDDLVTPTMKKKRRNILDHYADDIEMLYEEN